MKRLVKSISLFLCCTQISYCSEDSKKAESSDDFKPTMEEKDSQTDLTVGESNAELQISGRVLLVKGQPYHLKGVNWSPADPGSDFSNINYKGNADTDIQLIKEAGFNTVRVYDPIVDKEVLDKLDEAGLKAIITVFAGIADDHHKAYVSKFKDHPAILMWSLGNEWNYNGLYSGWRPEGQASYQESVEVLKRVAAEIKSIDPGRPITTNWGGYPTINNILDLPEIDVWSLNVYSGINFEYGANAKSLSQIIREFMPDSLPSDPQWKAKPVFFGEYGADSWNASSEVNRYDENSQAEAVGALTRLINKNLSSENDGNVLLGGIVFEFCDELWKFQQMY